MTAILTTMALLSKILLLILLSGLLFAWLIEAQTETVYLTQTQTLFNTCACSCQCLAGGPAGTLVSPKRPPPCLALLTDASHLQA